MALVKMMALAQTAYQIPRKRRLALAALTGGRLLATMNQ
jgi:hypothetical protein